MCQNAFERLCYLVRNVDGVLDSRYVRVEEKVAMFLSILVHHKNNRIIGHDYLRSGHIVSTHFHEVLRAILMLHTIFLVKPFPVDETWPHKTWTWFKRYEVCLCIYRMGRFCSRCESSPRFMNRQDDLKISREEPMASLATTDICDSNEPLLESGDIRILPPIFHMYGKRRAFSGPIATLKVFEDNVLVREFLESKGDGRVLVVDGGGSTKCALVGGNLGQLAQNNGWAGIVVNGCIRDVNEIDGCDIGVRALAAHPKKSKKRGAGERHIPIHIAGAEIRDGEWLYADSDGILISKTELSV